MVRYGAELVFKSDAANVTDADVEAIIAKGEKDTKALNDKMAQFTENAMQFTMDGGIAYEFKDEDEDEEVRSKGRACGCAENARRLQIPVSAASNFMSEDGDGEVASLGK